MKKTTKLLAIILATLSLTGCTKYLKDEKKPVQNPETGQNLVQNILKSYSNCNSIFD